MVKMVRYALDHPLESMRLGELGAANTLEQHRWNNRVQQMMTWI